MKKYILKYFAQSTLTLWRRILVTYRKRRPLHSRCRWYSKSKMCILQVWCSTHICVTSFPHYYWKCQKLEKETMELIVCSHIFLKNVNLHPDPARALKVTVMMKENQMPKMPKRFRTLWFFTGANMSNDWKGEQSNVIFNSIDFSTQLYVTYKVTNSPVSVLSISLYSCD